MSEEQPEGRTPGAMEQEVLDIFAQRGWRNISLEQRGPDGTEVLAMLLFHICPVCSACVPLGDEQNPLPDEHLGFHLGEAQKMDEIVAGLQPLLVKTFGDPE